MDPQDLVLAQQAGIIGPQPAPEPVLGPQPDLTPNPFGEAPVDPTLGPSFGEADLSFLPPLPSEMPYSPQPDIKTSGSIGLSQSSSERGFSPEKYSQIRRGPGARLDRDLAAAEAEAEAAYAPHKAESRAISGLLAGAENAAHQANLEILVEKGKGQEDAFLLARNLEHKLRAAQEAAALQSQAALANYRASQEEFAAMEMDPGQIFDRAGAANSFAMGAAAFIHDFLGAGGVKTSAMDTFNRAQELNIRAQVENMRHKGEVTQGFKNLWEMTRMQSATEEEAMVRMHGYSLKALEARVTADMGKYDSRLAGAKHQAALAEIRQARLDNEMKFQTLQDQKYSNAAKHLMDRYGVEMSNAQAAAQRANTLKIAEMEDKRIRDLAEASRTTNKPYQRQVIDPLTNRGILRFKPGITEKEMEKVTDMVAKYEPAAKGIKEMRELARKAGASNDALKGTRLDVEDRRQLHAMALTFARNMLAATGERATDKDMEQVLKTLETDTTLTRGYTGKVLAYFEKTIHDKMKGYTRQYLEDTPENEQEVGPAGLLNEDQVLESEASATQVIPKANDPSKHAAYAQYAISKPDGFVPIADDSLEDLRLKDGAQGVKRAFKEFQESPQALNYEHLITHGKGTSRVRESTLTEDVLGGVTGGGNAFARLESYSDKPDVAFSHLYRLWERSSEDMDARATLAKYASYDDGKNEVDPDLSQDQKQLLDSYATFLLNRGD